jgi:hypothetical protein
MTWPDWRHLGAGQLPGQSQVDDNYRLIRNMAWAMNLDSHPENVKKGKLQSFRLKFLVVLILEHAAHRWFLLDT